MKTEFRQSLASRIYIAKKGGHWSSRAGELITLPAYAGSEVVSIRRALYAARVTPLAADVDVQPKCGKNNCIRPEHQQLVEKPGSLLVAISLERDRTALQETSVRYTED